MKLPSFQFYPGDWLKDANLRLCSKAEKGMWIDLICLAFECDERGKFITNGTPWTLKQIAAALPGGSKMNLKLIQNLLRKDVLKVDDRGMFYCARIVRDEEIRKKRSHSGEMGGNPNFKDGKSNPYYPKKDKQKDKQNINNEDNQNITPSSSSSSSPSKPLTTTPPPQNGAASNDPPKKPPKETIPFWQDMIDHIGTTWVEFKRKKTGRDVPGYPWPNGNDRLWGSLKSRAKLYQAFGIMGLWDIFLTTDDDWVRSTGYSIDAFLHKIPSLVDDPRWKSMASKHEARFLKPGLSAIGIHLNVVGGK